MSFLPCINSKSGQNVLNFTELNNCVISRLQLVKQEQQRVAVVDPERRISFLFARCRPTQPRCGAKRACTVHCCMAAAMLR